MPSDYEFGKYYLVLDKKVDRHIQSSNNPHKVTKAQIGLDKVENLSPAEMPISDKVNKELARIDDRIDRIASFSNSYDKLTKLSPYLYEAEYSLLDYEYAVDTLNDGSQTFINWGSAFKYGNLIGRNIDSDYDTHASFLIRTPNAASRYAVLGMATGIADLTESSVDNRDVSLTYKILPFVISDGINEKGVFACVNAVSETAQLIPALEIEPTEEQTAEYSALMLVRYILDNFDNAQEAVNHIKEHIKVLIPKGAHTVLQAYQWMVCDKNKSFVLAIAGSGKHFEIIEVTENPVMTDFNYYTNTERRSGPIHVGKLNDPNTKKVYTPASQTIEANAVTYNNIALLDQGLERYNSLVTSIYTLSLQEEVTAKDIQRELQKVFYSKVYTLDNISNPDKFFFTDYNRILQDNGGGDVTQLTVISKPSDYIEEVARIKDIYEHRTREILSNTKETALSCVYDIKGNRVFVQNQENTLSTYSRNITDDFQNQIDEIRDKLIPEAVEAEAEIRFAADEDLSSRLESEISRATSEEERIENSLNEKIDAEIERSTQKDQQLSNSLNSEINRAEGAEQTLSDRIDALESSSTEDIAQLRHDLDEEIVRSTGQDAELDRRLNEEVLRASGVEGDLSIDIHKLGDDLDTEIENARRYEAELDSKIDAETSRATRAEGQLAQDLTDEASARSEKDTDLQSQIDAIEARTDVVDVVGTYAELLAYDTSTLSDKDIIKVLADERPAYRGATTFNRWLKSSRRWEYVGSVGPYYTIAEADDKFVPYTNATKDVDLDAHELKAGKLTIQTANKEKELNITSATTSWVVGQDRPIEFSETNLKPVVFTGKNEVVELSGENTTVDLKGKGSTVKLSGVNSQIDFNSATASIKVENSNVIKNAEDQTVYTFKQGTEYTSGLLVNWSADNKKAIYSSYNTGESQASDTDKLLTSNKFVLNTVTTGYKAAGNIRSGDVIEEADLINAFTKHLPITINNNLLHYQGSKTVSNQNIVEYINILEKNGKTNVVLYEFNLTTKVLTYREYESQDVGFISISSDIPTEYVLPEADREAVQKVLCFISFGSTTLSKTASNLNEYIFTSIQTDASQNYKLNAVELRINKSSYQVTKIVNSYIWYSKDTVDQLLTNKQDILIDDNEDPNQNIKTINTRSILGQGDFHITEGAVLTTGTILEQGDYQEGQMYYCTEASESFEAGSVYVAISHERIVKLLSSEVSTLPAIQSFSVSPTSTEFGDKKTVTYNYSLKKYTKIRNLALDGTIIAAEPASATGTGTASMSYDNHTFILSANGVQSKSASITPQYRHFIGVMGSIDIPTILASLKDVVSDQGLIKTYLQNSIPSSFNMNLGQTVDYVYFIVKGTITSVKSGGYDVPIDLLQSDVDFTNHFDATYKVNIYRTSNKIRGQLDFNIQ